MAIYSNLRVITDSADGTFSDGSVETLKIGVSVSDIPSRLGTVAGFVSGGTVPSAQTTIDKFPFSISGGTATDVGDLNFAKAYGMTYSSSTDGFNAGGSPPTVSLDINKFPFAISSGTATDVGDLSTSRNGAARHSSSTDGFASGGMITPAIISSIDKFPFAISGGTATDVGDLSEGRRDLTGSGNSSETSGFVAGGKNPTYPSIFTAVTSIDKFPFSISGGTGTDVGDLSEIRYGAAEHSTTIEAFNSGGSQSGGGPITTTMDKFPFAISGGTATDIGDLTAGRLYSASQSSTTDGFVPTGLNFNASPLLVSGIDKFPFSQTSGTAADVGDLSQDRYAAGGHQD